jgi:hypothetical protein
MSKFSLIAHLQRLQRDTADSLLRATGDAFDTRVRAMLVDAGMDADRAAGAQIGVWFSESGTPEFLYVNGSGGDDVEDAGLTLDLPEAFDWLHAVRVALDAEETIGAVPITQPWPEPTRVDGDNLQAGMVLCGFHGGQTLIVHVVDGSDDELPQMETDIGWITIGPDVSYEVLP